MLNDDLARIQELTNQKTKIDNEIQSIYKSYLSKYQDSKDIVKDDNPYSRLFALKKMGIVSNYEQFALKTILIIGVGGVGSVLAEMLTRCGIGKLILYYYDKVELANMNRLFFTPEQVGLSKVDAAKATLNKINPNTVIECFNENVTTNDAYKKIIDNIKKGGIEGKPADLIISCVDNYAARMTVNSICNEIGQIWIESGVSEDALSCHFQVMVPGETACFACIPPIAFAEAQTPIKREGVCAASLPTTMGITAGLVAQTALKLLLEFEDISYYLQYNARCDFFTNNTYKPSPECRDERCREKQVEVAKTGISFMENRRKLIAKGKEDKGYVKNPYFSGEQVKPLDWGIELVEESKGQKTEAREARSSTTDLKT